MSETRQKKKRLSNDLIEVLGMTKILHTLTTLECLIQEMRFVKLDFLFLSPDFLFLLRLLACLLACAPPGSVSVSAGLQPNVLIRSHVIHMQMSHYLGITSTTDVTSASSSSVSQLSKSASVIRQASCLVSSNINLAIFSSFNT